MEQVVKRLDNINGTLEKMLAGYRDFRDNEVSEVRKRGRI
jgi:hypothetical protein